MTYQEFLTQMPVLVRACRELAPLQKTGFIDLLHQQRGVSFGNRRLAWYAFEEIGWPEGLTYTFDALRPGPLCSYDMSKEPVALTMCGEKHGDQSMINPRLELRRAHWRKPLKGDFVAAHQALTGLYDNYLKSIQ